MTIPARKAGIPPPTTCITLPRALFITSVRSKGTLELIERHAALDFDAPAKDLAAITASNLKSATLARAGGMSMRDITPPILSLAFEPTFADDRV
jgi:hypothetical protein